MLITRLKYTLHILEHLYKSVNDKVLIFVHLPRCGGTTFSNILRSNYNPWRIFSYAAISRRTLDGKPASFGPAGLQDLKIIEEFLEKRQNKIECVMGHIPYGAHQLFERECRYISIIRNPVSRVWSSFNYLSKRPDVYTYPLLEKHNLELEKILKSGEVFELCNEQARLLLGTSKIDMGEIDIEKLIDHVSNKYFYIDTLERFDQGLLILKSLLGWKHINYKHYNIGDYKIHIDNLDENLVQVIKEKNAVDQALYEYLLIRGPIINP